MNPLDVLKSRGYIDNCTNEEELSAALLYKKPMAFYIGFDCTAKSLHVGSLVQIMIMRTLQKAGHKPIILLGGGTTKIGDPSGKDEARQLLSDEIIEENKKSLAKVFSQFLEFGEEGNGAIMVDNADWLSDINYLDFLRDIGRHFSINRMLTFESVKLRLERQQPLSFLEFNYILLQSYDFVELSRKYDCRLQIGGSDQWGNIVSGIDLGRRLGCPSLYGLTTPLLTTASGKKMGKTEAGAVWLNSDMLSVYDYWQFWRNTEDSDVIKFLRLFTDLNETEISELSKLKGAELNEVKIILANQATALCHGAQAAQEAHETAIQTFSDNAMGAALPVYELDSAVLSSGELTISQLFAESGIVSSKAEAKRLIIQGGARLNNEVVSDPLHIITAQSFDTENTCKLSAGKKKHIKVTLC